MLRQLILVLALALLLVNPASAVQTAPESVAAEIGALRLRAILAADATLPITLYQAGKAQAWLDFAFEEYVERDDTGVAEDALSRARQLVGWMESKQPEGKPEPETIRGVARVREDLWSQLGELTRQAPGYPCAAPYLGRIEVQLIWAGHELPELGERHAQPEIDEALQLLDVARKAAQDCIPAGPLPPGASRGVGATMSETALRRAVAQLPESVHFAFDKTDIDASTDKVLRDLADTLRAYPWLRLELVGHTDRIGSPAYNVKLSQHRAQRVKQRLIGLGLPDGRFATRGVGKSSLLMQPDGLDARARDRRVQFVISNAVDSAGVALSIQMLVQEADLQPGETRRMRRTSKKPAERGARHD